jgi:molecular chaperone Hsp33
VSGPTWRNRLCSRDRVSNMLRGLGREEADDMFAEAGQIEVGCEFCGKHYRFDPIDVSQMFTPENERAQGSGTLQ